MQRFVDVDPPRVISRVVHDELCSGCGVCTGIYPQSALYMDINSFGEINRLSEVRDYIANYILSLFKVSLYMNIENL